MRGSILMIAIFANTFASFCVAEDETSEPPLNLTLIIDGKQFPTELGQQKVITGEFKNPTIVVRAAETRQFAYGGIAFDYPANFTWEAEVDENIYKCWTVSGNDSKIMYFVLGTDFTPELFVKQMTQQFGADNLRDEPVTREFGKTKLKGKRMIIKSGGIEIVQDALAIPAPENQWRMLVLQDVVPERTPELEEPKRVLELLSKTFALKK